MDDVFAALPGRVVVTPTPLNTPATSLEQRQELGRQEEYQVDRMYTGVPGVPTRELLVEIKTCSPRSGTHTAASPSSATTDAAAARSRHAFGDATYRPVLHASQTLMVFVMEIFGGCTRSEADGSGLVQTLTGFAQQISKAAVPGDADAEGVAKRRAAVIKETMQGWRVMISTRLARARAQWLERCVNDCLSPARRHAAAAAARMAAASVRHDLRALTALGAGSSCFGGGG